MSLSDFPVSYMSDVRVLTFSDRSADADNTRISRFPCMECPGMHRVFDSARPSSDSRYRRPTRGLPPHATGSAPRSCDFGAQYLACPSPDQRFTPGVTAKGAWPGATVGRYSFHVGLFHPLLHAGFNRRSLRVPGCSQDVPAAAILTVVMNGSGCGASKTTQGAPLARRTLGMIHQTSALKPSCLRLIG